MVNIIHLTFISFVSGWGGDGHRIITQLALGQISNKAQSFLYKLLGSERAVLTASVWADTDAAKRDYPDSGAYHFCNTPYRRCGEFRIDRDCGRTNDQVCIVTALADVIETLVDIEAPQHKRTDSLKFLIHLMGDIHQPLHVGFREDTGGNAIKLENPKNMDLHFLWDTWLVDQLVRATRPSSWKHVADSLLAVSPSHADGIPDDIFEDRDSLMAYVSNLATNTATLTTCSEAYRDHTGMFIRGRGHALDQKLYLARKLPVVQQQLNRAGFQLAQLIEAISDEEFRRRSSAKAERREARIEKAALFSKLGTSTARRFSSRFALLPIEFGPEIDDHSFSAIASPQVAVAKKVKSKKAGKPKSRDADFNSVLAEFEAIDEATKNYELIHGIDLSRIQAVLRSKPDGSHYRLVTDKATLLRDPEFLPMNFYIYKTYLPVNGTYELETFHFDLAYFGAKGANCSDEVRIRALLKLANKDCTIDISDLLSSPTDGTGAAVSAFAPVLDPVEAGMNFDLIPEMLAERTRRIAELANRLRKSKNLAEKRRPFIFAFNLGLENYQLAVFVYGNITAIFTRKTLTTNGDWMRVNWGPRLDGTSEQKRFLLLDTDIYEGCTNVDEFAVIHHLGSLSRVYANPDDARLRPSLMDELKAINYLASTKDDVNTIRTSPEREVIHQYVLYDDEDSAQKFKVLEWQRSSAVPLE
jgi:hypothetical protein